MAESTPPPAAPPPYKKAPVPPYQAAAPGQDERSSTAKGGRPVADSAEELAALRAFADGKLYVAPSSGATLGSGDGHSGGLWPARGDADEIKLPPPLPEDLARQQKERDDKAQGLGRRSSFTMKLKEMMGGGKGKADGEGKGGG